MEFISLIDIENYLLDLINNYHNYIYLILLIAVFTETGLVIASFPPGDATAFLLGSLAGAGVLNIYILLPIVFIGVLLGDNSSFFIGKFLGNRLFANPNSKIFKRNILNNAHNLYKRHGIKTVFLGRFTPILRSFTPFIAGIGHMPYHIFLSFNILSIFAWVTILLGTGFIFGNVSFIKNNFSLLIILMLVFSVLPIIKLIYNEIKTK
jgi:membrane-associated protein